MTYRKYNNNLCIHFSQHFNFACTSNNMKICQVYGKHTLYLTSGEVTKYKACNLTTETQYKICLKISLILVIEIYCNGES